jgi:hypothetical protein
MTDFGLEEADLAGEIGGESSIIRPLSRFVNADKPGMWASRSISASSPPSARRAERRRVDNRWRRSERDVLSCK